MSWKSNATVTKERVKYEDLKYKSTPVIVYSVNEGIALTRKTTEIECATQVYSTNYAQLILSKEPISAVNHDAPVNNAQLHLYFNNKIDFVAFTHQTGLKEMYYNIVHQMCKINKEVWSDLV